MLKCESQARTDQPAANARRPFAIGMAARLSLRDSTLVGSRIAAREFLTLG
jgi:hypothetical protein